MAERPSNPFLAATQRRADALSEKGKEVEKDKPADWTKEFLPMAQVRRRLERASTNEERRAIRLEIAKSRDGEKKMGQLLRQYRRGR